MKHALLLILLLPLAASADVPNKPTKTRYSVLWTDSPFTSKPVAPVTERVEENPLDDYALGGVSKLEDGYFVVLLNKKDPADRQVIEPGVGSGFEVLSVKWDMTGGKGTTVRVRKGTDEASIGYDEKLLTVKTPAPAAKPPQPGQPGQPVIPGVNPNTPTSPGSVRAPRPRVVRPPTPPTPPAGR